MAKKKGTAVVSMKDMEDAMALQVSDATARINQPAGNVIGIRNAQFTYKQETLGDELNIILLDFIHQNAYYDSKFNPDNPLPPACFAQSADGIEMQPHPSSPDLQNEFCDGCIRNAWGSSTEGSGEGKACKNQYRFAVLEPTDDPAEGDIALLTAPSTSLKNWDQYVRDLSKLIPARAPNSVLTLVTFDQDADWPLLCFEADKKIEDGAYYAGILARMGEARKALLEPIDVSNYEAPKSRKKSKKVTKKKAKKRKF